MTEVAPVVDARAYPTWMERSMIFQNTPLDRLAREVEWSCGVRVELADPALGSRTITASYESPSLEEVVRVVCRAVEAECGIEAGRVVMEPGREGRDGECPSVGEAFEGAVAMP